MLLELCKIIGRKYTFYRRLELYYVLVFVICQVKKSERVYHSHQSRAFLSHGRAHSSHGLSCTHVYEACVVWFVFLCSLVIFFSTIFYVRTPK